MTRRARLLLGQFDESQQGVGCGVAGADDDGVLAGEQLPVGTEHVREASGDPAGGDRVGFAVGGQPVGAEHVRGGPGAGGVKDSAGEDLLAAGEADHEGPLVPAVCP